MSILDRLKKIPVDFGQGHLRDRTKGKMIALSLVDQANGDSLALDVGCREGIQTKWLEERGYKVIAIDTERSFERCVVMDANLILPFKDDEFDLIWCSAVIEHLENPAFSISEFRRILKKGGKMVLTTANSHCLPYKFLYSIGFTAEQLQNKGHLHFFNEKDIRALFPKSKLYGFFPYFLIKKTIENHIGLLSPSFVIVEEK